MGIVGDLRYALRALTKNRGFATVAILSLALGIGANTTVFTMLNAVLLRPLSVREPERLAALYTLDSRSPGYFLCSYLNYKDYRDRNQVFSSLLLYSPILIDLTGRGEPQTLMAQIVTGNYFSTLGVNAVVGRTFLPEEDVNPGANPVAVISHGLWTRVFGGDPHITSRTIRLNNYDFRIVGVAPPEFHGVNGLYAGDVWVPMMMYPQVFPAVAAVNQRRALYFSVAGRLKPGVTLAQAEGAMQSLAQSLAREYPMENQGRRIKLLPAAEAAIAPKTRGAVTSAAMVLMTVSGLVLLIACANVANLLLARAAGRNKEITVRLALGASRWQLMRQLLVESTMLSVAGGLLSLLVARWARDLLWSMRPPDFKYAGFRLDLDTKVFAYSLAISVLTGILFGLIPAIRATSADLATDLKERAGTPPSTRGSWHPRSLLVMGQVAFSLIALVGAGLFMRSLWNVTRLDPGFDAVHLGVVSFNVGDQGYSEARGREFQRRALELAAAVPGVASATLAKDSPLHVGSSRVALLQGQDTTGRLTLTCVTWPGYFRTVAIPLLRGRDFSPQDLPAAPRVAIVNEVAAAHFWPGEEAVGKVIQFAGENLPVRIVGVARNANYREIGEPPEAMIYLSLVQYYFPYSALYVRTAGNPDAVLGAVRQQMRALDRNLVLDTESIPATIRASLWAQRLSASLLAVFGCLALLLATIGIYGVISYSVHQRMREMGLRMAMGATSMDVQRLILREGMRLVAIGVLVGTILSLAISRHVKSMLFAVSEWDAATFLLVPGFLALVAMLACWIPARRATHIDPATALREE
jgi:predicted permease